MRVLISPTFSTIFYTIYMFLAFDRWKRGMSFVSVINLLLQLRMHPSIPYMLCDKQGNSLKYFSLKVSTMIGFFQKRRPEGHCRRKTSVFGELPHPQTINKTHQTLLCVVFASSHGVNIPTMANFYLPMWCHWRDSWVKTYNSTPWPLPSEALCVPAPAHSEHRPYPEALGSGRSPGT